MPQYTAKLLDGRNVTINLPFKMHINTDSELFLRAAWFWTKEPETLAWINSFGPNCLFWDIGANVGCYSLFCIAQHPRAFVTAFEPFLPNHKALVANIELNGWQRCINAPLVALSNECGMANFESKSLETGSSGGQIGRVGSFLPQSSWPVDVTTGDEWSKLNGVPDYIKIDVDGQELAILQGMEQVLADRKVEGVLVEVNNDGEAIDKLLRGHGFAPDAALMALRRRESDHNAIYRR